MSSNLDKYRADLTDLITLGERMLADLALEIESAKR